MKRLLLLILCFQSLIAQEEIVDDFIKVTNTGMVPLIIKSVKRETEQTLAIIPPGVTRQFMRPACNQGEILFTSLSKGIIIAQSFMNLPNCLEAKFIVRNPIQDSSIEITGIKN